MHQFYFHYHLANEEPKVRLVFAEDQERAYKLAIKAGLNFDACGRCGDPLWYLKINLPLAQEFRVLTFVSQHRLIQAVYEVVLADDKTKLAKGNIYVNGNLLSLGVQDKFVGPKAYLRELVDYYVAEYVTEKGAH